VRGGQAAQQRGGPERHGDPPHGEAVSTAKLVSIGLNLSGVTP
jgi:hypothetical protein